MAAIYTYSNVEENRFWLQVLGGSALSILNRLPSQSPDVQQAKVFSEKFDKLIDRANQNPAGTTLSQLNQDAYAVSRDFRAFVLNIVKDQMTKGIVTFTKPIHLVYMVYYAELYMRLLEDFLKNVQPQFDPLSHDLFWMRIFYVDAVFINDNVGYFQRETREKARTFADIFSQLYLFATAIKDTYIIGTDFPAADDFRNTARTKMEDFARFIVELITLVQKNRLPGTLTLLDLDNIYRRLCYYTTQLSAIAGLIKPACDPGGPRLSNI